MVKFIMTPAKWVVALEISIKVAQETPACRPKKPGRFVRHQRLSLQRWKHPAQLDAVGGGIMALRIDERVRTEILRIASSHGAIGVRVFGSVARGDATAGSDLDLLVKMKPGASLLDLIAIKQDLEDLLGIRVDIVTEKALSPYIKDDVLSHAVAL